MMEPYHRNFVVGLDWITMRTSLNRLSIRFCLQNNEHLSAHKRTNHFEFLTDGKVTCMEAAILSAYGQFNTPRN